MRLYLPFHNAKVKDGELYAKKLFSDWIRISPDEIRDARAYLSKSQPFIGFATEKGHFRVSLLSRRCPDALRYIQERTAFRPFGSLAFRTSMFLFRWRMSNEHIRRIEEVIAPPATKRDRE